MKKTKEFRDQSLNELEAEYRDASKNLFLLNNEARGQKRREKPHEIKHLKKEIARMLTVMTEKQRQKQA